MEVVGKRRPAGAAAAPRNGIVSGSVWESRMNSDQVRGGIKVFSSDEISDGDGDGDEGKKLEPKLTVSVTNAKRKTWKSDISISSNPNPIQIDETVNNIHQQFKDIRVPTADDDDDGIDKFSPSTIPRKKMESESESESELGKELIVSVLDDGVAKNSIRIRRIKSRFEETTMADAKSPADHIKPIQKPIQLRKVKSEINTQTSSGSIEGTQKDPFPSEPNTIIKDEEHTEKQTGMEIGSASKLLLVEKTDEIVEEKQVIVPVEEDKSKQIVNERKKKMIKKKNQTQERPVPIVKKQPPSSNTKFNRVTQKHNRLQALVDLVMWVDVSKSAFVFGFGTFLIVSSSYTKEVNISLISVVSYLGLVYLAVIFLSRSIIRRGTEVADDDDENDTEDSMNEKYYVIGEEEAMWLMRKILPCLNEFLLKLKALFSGDPSTTMKLSMMLYVLARCGSSITVWKMVKFGFIGIFTVPKICSSYSTQFTAYSNFWFRRFEDAWVSCSHKKAVSFAIFTLFWNLSSVVARCWALFMLFVAFRYYKESGMRMNKDEEEEDGVERKEAMCKTPIGYYSGRRVRSTLLPPTSTTTTTNTNSVSKKDKKKC